MKTTNNPFSGIFISDTDTETDLLYYDAIAKTIVNLIRCSGEKPISIGVHGDWGAGKTSVLRMTQAQLATDKNVLCLWFNGWQFEGFEDAKAALIETIILELRDQRSDLAKVTEATADVLKRLDYLKLAKMAVKYGGTFVTGIPHPELIKDAYDALKAAAGMIAGKATPEDINKSLEEGSALLNKAKEGKKVPEEMKEFHRSFKALLEAAHISRLVVLIDDLDRCLPETAIATLEAIRLFLFTDKTAFVIGADEQMIEYSVKKHFPDLPKSGMPDSYSRSYLEKLIQVPFRIPVLGPVETQCYVTLVMAEAILTQPENKDAFKRLADMAKVSITKPWEAQPIEAKQIEDVIKGEVAVPLKEAVSISAQIYRVLSDGTKGNPRLIKRFLNAVLLRYGIAAERQLGNVIRFPQLAKIMLAERFHPSFFDKLVSAVPLAPDNPNVGKVSILRFLEQPGDEKKDEKAKEKPLPSNAEDAKLLEEWKQDPWVTTWAKIQPYLSGEDLRPYIFVTRDRRQSIFGYALGSKLADLIERLCQNEFTISAATDEVKGLNTREITEVAQHFKSTIMASGDFARKPRGYEGLVAVATQRPETRPILLSLFQNLPPAQLGGWAWPGLKGLGEDPALRSEVTTLAKVWEEKGSTGLKKAIAAFKE
jgi:predicted KAP-like P-loop ATPase